MGGLINVGRVVISTLGSFLVVCLGGLDQLLVSLLVFMALDILTGLLISFVTHKTSSKVMFVGILKKLVELLVVIVTVRLDTLVLSSLGLSLHFREFFLVYVILDELLSLVENACQLGIFPESFRVKFIQVKEDFVVSLSSTIFDLVKSLKDSVLRALTKSNKTDKDSE